MPRVPPPLPRRPLPAEIVAAREDDERAHAENRRILEPLIEAHLTGNAAAIDELDAAHRLVADETELELEGRTRMAATWLITGRCIGLARASHDLAAAGYSSETVPVLRSLHEASRLLALLTFQGEDDVVERWVKGRHVPRRDIMAAINRQEEAMRVTMTTEGLPPPATTRGYFEGQYGIWSEFAHHRRRHMLDDVALSIRVMVTGPHPDWRSRATMVDHYGWYVAELVSSGGSALGQLLGREFFDRFQRTFRALLELHRRIPLEDIATGKVPPLHRID